ncbi:hypothetical protein [Kitasatospora sp. NBC_01302]|uniref:hypothetical protein n=1 Tax=Kitasatospora sp. NBC_01302 TaxID=2903575 RepID=UPI002E0E759F|nr:hypothetical protein OG294_27750 [Kitasatospora sp. NBC_01302]
MTHKPDPTPAQLRALAAAVALTTATGLQDTGLTVEDLLGDADPLQVVSVLSCALHAALGTVLGADGRTTVLQHLGLGALQDGDR